MLHAVSVSAYSLPLTGSLPGCPPGRREGLLLQLIDQGGQSYFGDCAPLPGFSWESFDCAKSQLVEFAHRLSDHPDRSADIQKEGLVRVFGYYSSSVVFSVESAVEQYVKGSAAGKSEGSGFEGKGQKRQFPVCALLSGTNSQMLQQAVELDPEIRCIKVKVARQSVQQDIELIKQLHQSLPGHIAIRLDANRGWSWAEAVEFASSVPRDRIVFIEEPLLDFGRIADFAASTGMPVALDESLQLNKRFQEYDELPEFFPGLQALVIKPTLVGGVCRTRQLASMADQYGLDLVISSSYESNIGIDFLSSLARQLAPDTAPGLDTLSILGSRLVLSSDSASEKEISVFADGGEYFQKIWPSHES